MDETTLSQQDFAEARAKVEPYIAAAADHGIHLRPITGAMLRLGDAIGVDINAVGEQGTDAPESAASDDDFYDHLMRAVWILSEDPARLSECIDGGDRSVEKAFQSWQMSHLTSLEIEAACMRAFIARWFEHRLEMARVFDAA